MRTERKGDRELVRKRERNVRENREIEFTKCTLKIIYMQLYTLNPGQIRSILKGL